MGKRSDLISSSLSLEEAIDLSSVPRAEVYLLPLLAYKGHVALQCICKSPRRSTEALDLALLGKLAQV